MFVFGGFFLWKRVYFYGTFTEMCSITVVQLTISHYWSRWRLVAEWGQKHYLNQWRIHAPPGRNGDMRWDENLNRLGVTQNSLYRLMWLHTIFADYIRYYLTHLHPGQNGRHSADDIFKCIFVNEKFRISIRISLKFVPKGPINNKLALIQVMVWRRTGDKPLFEPMLTHFTDVYMRHYGEMC